MNDIRVKIVIGANYGDEGKGLATHYFSKQKGLKEKCLNVLFNGSCQRGHTVDLEDGRRHVFHHFGSGTLNGAATYFDSNFIVNPIFFCQEYDELGESFMRFPRCFISPECRVATPYDAFINQIVEQDRAKKGTRHGSCGFGVWETQQRYKEYDDAHFKTGFNQRYTDLLSASNAYILNMLKGLAEVYVPRRLKEYGIEEIPEEYKKLLVSENLRLNWLMDFRRMNLLTKLSDFESLTSEYKYIIFEGGQGLALDENNTAMYPHVTASDTTSAIPLERVKDLTDDIEICYITRSYFTRHGAGPFPTEISKDWFGLKLIEDKTNVPNEYQESIRYGLFDVDELLARVSKDMTKAHQVKNNVKCSLCVTHMNWPRTSSGYLILGELTSHFDNMYISDKPYDMYPTKIE